MQPSTRVLIIDRHGEDARQLAWMLTSTDHRRFTVTIRETLPEPLAESTDGEADLLLLVMEGGELDSLRRSREAWPRLPAILIGNDEDETLARRAIRLGAQELLIKGRLEPAALRRAALHAVERGRAAAPLNSADLGALLDHLPHGVLFLDHALRVVLTNAPARALLTDDAPLRIGRDHRLRTADPEQGRLLGALITAVRRGELEERGRALLLGGDGRRPLAVLAAALGRGGEEGGAALFISDPHTPPEVARDTLASLYGLTPAEAKLVALLARGLTLDAIAERAHLSPHTLRSQLKQVFRKTATTRQSELLKLILTGPAVITPPGGGGRDADERGGKPDQYPNWEE